MPWKVFPMREQRLALVHRVTLLARSVAEVAREFGVSRKTAYKWLKRFRQGDSLVDQSRRPKRSPRRSDSGIEAKVLEARQRYNWGPRKIRKLLEDEHPPTIRTVGRILKRLGCVPQTLPTPQTIPQPFERPAPNDLWQIDHKGYLEVQRQKVMPLTVLDDHSRYCLCLHPCLDLTMSTAWQILWELFGQVGLPGAILSDNAFGKTRTFPGISGFDMRLIRLGIHPLHGRPYHPQTQGKVERLHGSMMRELFNFNARRDCIEHFTQDCENWRIIYNTQRPHEALMDQTPICRWKPSHRKRPDELPQISYPADAILRRVSYSGDFRYRNARILVGRALAREWVRIEVADQDIAVYYGWKRIRVIHNQLLNGPRCDKMV